MEQVLFNCPICAVSSTVSDWNRRTMVAFGKDITKIDTPRAKTCIFACPVCDHEEMYTNITRIEAPTPTQNEDALGFLRKSGG